MNVTAATESSRTVIETRVAGYDWQRIAEHVDAHGWARLPRLLERGECAAVAAMYSDARLILEPMSCRGSEATDPSAPAVRARRLQRDFLAGSLPAASGRRMRFGGTTVVKVVNGRITEEIGLDDGVIALTQRGLLCR